MSDWPGGKEMTASALARARGSEEPGPARQPLGEGDDLNEGENFILEVDWVLADAHGEDPPLSGNPPDSEDASEDGDTAVRLGQTPDSLRLYLRELALRALLGREAEAQVAKRIEEGQHRMVAEAPATVRAVHVADGQMVDAGAVMVELEYGAVEDA